MGVKPAYNSYVILGSVSFNVQVSVIQGEGRGGVVAAKATGAITRKQLINVG